MSNKPNFGKRKKTIGDLQGIIDMSFQMSDSADEAFNNLTALLDQFQIPGGCDHCEAYQTVPEQKPGSRLIHINVHHDDDCPVYVQHIGRPK